MFLLCSQRWAGTVRHVSQHHLQRCVGEFDLKYNPSNMSDGKRTLEVMKGVEGKRLTCLWIDDAAHACTVGEAV
jgi:hypothetical protein